MRERLMLDKELVELANGATRERNSFVIIGSDERKSMR